MLNVETAIPRAPFLTGDCRAPVLLLDSRNKIWINLSLSIVSRRS